MDGVLMIPPEREHQDKAPREHTSEGHLRDLELATETLRIPPDTVPHKVYFVDLKENAHGKYFKISERRRTGPNNSCVVPQSGLAQFVSCFRYYAEEAVAGRSLQSRHVIVERKAFAFTFGSDVQGPYLCVSELGSRNMVGGSSVVIPLGLDGTHLRLFRDCLDRMAVVLSCLDVGDKPAVAVPAPRRSRISMTDSARDTAEPRSSILSQIDTLDESAQVERRGDGQVLLTVAGDKQFCFHLGSDDHIHIAEVGDAEDGPVFKVPVNAVAKFYEAMVLAKKAPTAESPIATTRNAAAVAAAAAAASRPSGDGAASDAAGEPFVVAADKSQEAPEEEEAPHLQQLLALPPRQPRVLFSEPRGGIQQHLRHQEQRLMALPQPPQPYQQQQPPQQQRQQQQQPQHVAHVSVGPPHLLPHHHMVPFYYQVPTNVMGMQLMPGSMVAHHALPGSTHPYAMAQHPSMTYQPAPPHWWQP